MDIAKVTNIPLIQQQSSPDLATSQSPNRETVQKGIESQGEQQKKKITEQVGKINQMLDQSQVDLKFKLFDRTGEYYVQMIDSKTDQVINEIPSKKILDYFSNLKELMGLSVDKRV